MYAAEPTREQKKEEIYGNFRDIWSCRKADNETMLSYYRSMYLNVGIAMLQNAPRYCEVWRSLLFDDMETAGDTMRQVAVMFLRQEGIFA